MLTLDDDGWGLALLALRHLRDDALGYVAGSPLNAACCIYVAAKCDKLIEHIEQYQQDEAARVAEMERMQNVR